MEEHNMGKLTLNENMLAVKEGMGKSTSLPLDALRLVYIFFPGSFKWRVITSTQSIDGYNLDDFIHLSRETASRLFEEFTQVITNERDFVLSGMKLCLADYNNHSTIISLKDIKKSKSNILEKLLHYRDARIEKLNKWLATYPAVTLQGGFAGGTAVIDKNGFSKGRDKFVAWKDVGTIQVAEKNFGIGDLLIIPKGVGTGMFSLKKYRYTLGNIKMKQKELYIAECNFWRTLEDNRDDIPQKIRELSELKEKGVLTEEKFIEAKKRLLAEI
jgi:hypothetical protein